MTPDQRSVDIEVARVGPVLSIVLNRPRKRNAMTDTMWARLDETLSDVDPDVRAIVIRGAGGSFCGGSDVTGLLDDPGSLLDRIRVSNRCVLAMHESPIPTVAVVDGIAAGSGANLALACDFVIASEQAAFAQLFIHRGLSVDSGASWLLPRLIGDRAARRLCLLGESVSGVEAFALGMVTETVPAAAIDEHVDTLTATLATLSPDALSGTKRLLNASSDTGFAEALEDEAQNQVQVIGTPAAVEAISDFRSRRP